MVLGALKKSLNVSLAGTPPAASASERLVVHRRLDHLLGLDIDQGLPPPPLAPRALSAAAGRLEAAPVEDAAAVGAARGGVVEGEDGPVVGPASAAAVAELAEEPLGRAQHAATDVLLKVFQDLGEELCQLAALDVDQVLEGVVVGVVYEVLSVNENLIDCASP